MGTAYKVLVSTVMLVTTFVGAVQADPLSKLASDNATVRPSGPRTGANGKNYFNIEGTSNTTNASYGVGDFNFGALAQTVVTVNSVQLVLTEANSAFTAPGTVTMSLDANTTLADIQPGTSPLAFDGTDPGTATDVSQGDLTLLGFNGGPFQFTTTGNINNGQQDTYTLGLTPAIQTELANRLNAGKTIRIVIGSGSATVAATWAGYSNTTYTGPTLKLDVTYATLGACCLRNTTEGACVLATQADCSTQGGIFMGIGHACNAGECATPTSRTTWGKVKTIYR